VQGSDAAPVKKRGRPSTAEGLGHPIDRHVGKRIKSRRLIRGLTQEELAAAVYLSFQQVQKYERGANRVSAGRLYELSKALSVPIQYFFDDFEDENAAGDGAGGLREEHPDFEGVDRIGDAELSQLVRAFVKLRSLNVRRSFIKLLASLVEDETPKPGD
jgi:transcriptional regulator with XRE-family HTH domain